MEDNIKEVIREVLNEYANKKDREIKVMQDNVEKLNKLLLGNGGIGICEKVRRIEGSIKPLWAIVSILGTAILGALVKLIWG